MNAAVRNVKTYLCQTASRPMLLHMKNVVATASVGLSVLLLVSSCDGGGSHADAKPDKTPGTDASDDTTNPGTDAKDGGGTEVGTDGGGVTCPAAGTCGGNIVGTWNITSSCLD